MDQLIFEQPLNEKMRSYLRLEYLSQQLAQNMVEDQQHRCFEPLFALCELCERCDYRSDVIKDIDRLLVTNARDDLETLNRLRTQLQQAGRLTESLKKNRFLSALRQRFSMPGASCNFDLPQLHYWLDQPFTERKLSYQQWIAPFQPLLTAVCYLLKLTRNNGEFHEATAEAGFFQGQDKQTLALIRVTLVDQGTYPTISGNRNRYAIHFVDFDTQKHSTKRVKFQLATCLA